MIVVVVIVIRIGRTGGHCSPPARQSQYHDSPLEAGKPVSMFQNSTDNKVLRSSNRMCPIKNFLSESSVLVLFDCPVRATFPFFVLHYSRSSFRTNWMIFRAWLKLLLWLQIGAQSICPGRSKPQIPKQTKSRTGCFHLLCSPDPEDHNLVWQAAWMASW